MCSSPRLLARPILLISILLFSTGCLGKVGVQVSRDPAADFSMYRTWSWIPPQPDPDRKPSAEEIELSARVREQIRTELALRGFRYRAKDADLGIDARLVIKRERHITNQPVAMQTLHSFHFGVSYEIQATRRRITMHHRGQLTIRVVDRHRQQEVWRAYYEKSVPDGFAPAVRAVVAAAMAEFPRVSDGSDEEEVRLVQMIAESRGDAE